MENIKLSESFFQEFFEDSSFAQKQPTLQIIQHRIQESTNVICFRVRLSDGIFSFANCGLDVSLRDQVAREGCFDDPSKCPVIKVLEYQALGTHGKKTMIVKKYSLISADVPQIGNPTSHNGDVETFRGLGAAKRRLNENVDSNAVVGTPAKVFKSVGGGGVIPIKDLSPYLSGKWRIAGIVTTVAQLKEIKSKKGPMNLFSFVIADKDGASLKVTAFAENADKFNQQILEGSSYYISGTPNCIRPANKLYNSTGCDYEVTLQNDSVVEAASIQIENPKFVLKKTSLDKISSHGQGAVDILAIIDKVEEFVMVKTKDGREVSRRNINLIDETATQITVTFWGEQATLCQYEEGSVMGIKGANVREYNGSYSLSVATGSRIEINPEGDDTVGLLQWYENERQAVEVKSISAHGSSVNFVEELRTFSAVFSPQADLREDRGIYFSALATIISVRHENALYMACPKEGCSKKVTEGQGTYHCTKCYATHTTFKYRYIVGVELADSVSTTWISLFDDQAEKLFGKSATEMGELQKSDPAAYNAVFNKFLFTTHTFRCRAKPESYNDVYRTKVQVFDVRPVNHAECGLAFDAVKQQLENL